ncbi:MAG TPA: hypothetical protein VN608_05615 [Clostridia bacterium]|nr:hypothetical protein [Clostridia bacterium]
MLTCKALLQYLSRFDPNEGVGVIVVDTEKRLHHITGGYDLLKEAPALLIETTESEPLDAIAEEQKEDVI